MHFCIPDWPTCRMSACLICAKVKLMKGTSHQEVTNKHEKLATELPEN